MTSYLVFSLFEIKLQNSLFNDLMDDYVYCEDTYENNNKLKCKLEKQINLYNDKKIEVVKIKENNHLKFSIDKYLEKKKLIENIRLSKLLIEDLNFDL